MINLETREQVLQRVCKKAGLVLEPGQAVEIAFRKVDDKYQIFANGKVVGRITRNPKQKLPYRIAIFGITGGNPGRTIRALTLDYAKITAMKTWPGPVVGSELLYQRIGSPEKIGLLWEISLGPRPPPRSHRAGARRNMFRAAAAPSSRARA